MSFSTSSMVAKKLRLMGHERCRYGRKSSNSKRWKRPLAKATNVSTRRHPLARTTNASTRDFGGAEFWQSSRTSRHCRRNLGPAVTGIGSHIAGGPHSGTTNRASSPSGFAITPQRRPYSREADVFRRGPFIGGEAILKRDAAIINNRKAAETVVDDWKQVLHIAVANGGRPTLPLVIDFDLDRLGVLIHADDFRMDAPPGGSRLYNQFVISV